MRPALPWVSNRAPYQVCRPGLPRLRNRRRPAHDRSSGGRAPEPRSGLVLGGLGGCVPPWHKSAGPGMDQGKERKFPGRRARHLLGTAHAAPDASTTPPGRGRSGVSSELRKRQHRLALPRSARGTHRGPGYGQFLGRARSPRALLPRIVPQSAHSLRRPGRRARARVRSKCRDRSVVTTREADLLARAPRDRGAPRGVACKARQLAQVLKRWLTTPTCCVGGDDGGDLDSKGSRATTKGSQATTDSPE
jgi:hypothetical protein